MCTLTWLVAPRGYEVFFNRDELNTRQRAAPPQKIRDAGVAVIAPRDTDAGGTWICVNEYGSAMCLLNNYAAIAATDRKDWISRGQLLRELAHMPAAAVIPHLRNQPLARYRGFTLALFDGVKQPRLLCWDGSQLSVADAREMPISSSSFDTARVVAARTDWFQKNHADTGVSAASLRNYHHSHGHGKGASSVCMHRGDASTVSFSHLVVTANRIDFHYHDGAPCEKHGISHVTMPRNPPAALNRKGQRMREMSPID